MDDFQRNKSFKIVIEDESLKSLENLDNNSALPTKSNPQTKIIVDNDSNSKTSSVPQSKKKTSGINWFLLLEIGPFILILISLILPWAIDYYRLYMPMTDSDSEVKNHIADLSVCYHYNQLNDYGKEIYDELLQQVYKGNNRFLIKGIKKKEFKAKYEEQIEKAVYALVLDHPEFFWLHSGYSYSYSGNELKIALATRKFWSLTTEKDEMISLYFDKIDEIVNSAGNCTSDYEKIKYVHDYLVNSIEYNHEAAEDSNDGDWSIENDYSFSSYGGIVNGSCVCAGYASAFQIIAQQLGFECAWVRGDTPGGGHAWNIIKIDGEYYWFDVTWDDIGDWEIDSDIRYNYFATTDEVMSEKHTPEYFEYPECNSDKYIQLIKENSGYFTLT